MVDSGERIEEIKALLSSQNKPLAYAKLLRLQEVSAGVDSSAVETLVASSRAILFFLVIDISDNDEEMYVYIFLSIYVSLSLSSMILWMKNQSR